MGNFTAPPPPSAPSQECWQLSPRCQESAPARALGPSLPPTGVSHPEPPPGASITPSRVWLRYFRSGWRWGGFKVLSPGVQHPAGPICIRSFTSGCKRCAQGLHLAFAASEWHPGRVAFGVWHLGGLHLAPGVCVCIWHLEGVCAFGTLRHLAFCILLPEFRFCCGGCGEVPSCGAPFFPPFCAYRKSRIGKLQDPCPQPTKRPFYGTFC